MYGWQVSSADNAIQTGCQAAAAEVLNWSRHDESTCTAEADRHTAAAGVLSQVQQAGGDAVRVKQPTTAEYVSWSQRSTGKAGAECQVASADSPGKAQHTGGACGGADQQTHFKSPPAVAISLFGMDSAAHCLHMC